MRCLLHYCNTTCSTRLLDDVLTHLPPSKPIEQVAVANANLFINTKKTTPTRITKERFSSASKVQKTSSPDQRDPCVVSPDFLEVFQSTTPTLPRAPLPLYEQGRQTYNYRNSQTTKGSFINSVTRDAAFSRIGFTSPPSSRSLFLEFRGVTLFFTAVRLLLVNFGLASRSIFAVRDCVTLESFLRFSPSPPSHA